MDDSAAELRVVIARLARAMRFQREDFSVTDSQLGALFALHFDGPMLIGRLAEHEKVRASSMNYTVNALVERGLILRRRTDGDARQVEIDLTDAGHGVVLDTLRSRDAWLSDRLATLSAEQRAQLIAIIPTLKGLYES